MINDLRIVEEYQMIPESKIIVYGGGAAGKKLIDFMNMLGCNIVNICDSNMEKKGDMIYGIEVCHISDLPELVDDNTIIVVASVYYKEIIKNVAEYVSLEKVFTRFAFILSVHLNWKNMKLRFPALVEEYMNNWRKTELDIAENFLKKCAIRSYADVAENAVMVYQPGKAGSTTLSESLKKFGVKASHCHYLFESSSDEKYVSWCQKVRRAFWGKIIIPIREPISRDMSDYFQAIGGRLAAMMETYQFTSLQEGFLAGYSDCLFKETNYETKYLCEWLNYSKYGYQFDFFDAELKKNFGIDVYEYPFDTERGYTIIKKGNVEVMVLQVEHMNELVPEMGEFLEVPDFKLISTNVGAKKEYTYMYQNFKEQVSLPKEYVEFYYKGNAAFEHFYSEEQRNKFFEEWKKYL